MRSSLLKTLSRGGIVLVLALTAACSQQSKLERHLANAERYRGEGRYDAAEIEYLNAQRIDPRNGRAIAGLGALYFDQGSPTKAVPRLIVARDLAPDDVAARSRLARAFLLFGRMDDARREAFAVLDRAPGDADALLVLAETSTTPETVAETRARITGDDAASHTALALLELRQDDRDAASDHAARALALDPSHAAAFGIQAGLAAAAKDADAALKALELAAASSPPRSPRQLALAQFHLGRGDSVAARRVLEATVERAPDFIAALVALAEIAATAGNHEEANELLDRVAVRDPEHLDASILRARIHLARGENTAAVALMEGLSAKFPEAAPLHQLLATAYLASGDTSRASASLARTVQLAPDNAEAILARSALQIRLGDPASAVLALRDLVRQRPDLTRARIVLADALRARGQPEDALQIYREAIQATPNDAQLHFFSGTLYAQLGRVAEARQAYERTLALRNGFTPAVEQLVALDIATRDLASAAQRADAHARTHETQAEAHILVAKVAVAQMDTARAEAALRRAIEMNPDAATAYMLLAQLYLGNNQQDDALSNLQTAIAKNPRDIGALMLTGILLQQKKEYDQARQAYERLLQVNPRFVPALNNLAYLYSENFGRLDDAFELANRARELRPNDPIALDTFGWILLQRKDYAWALTVLSESASKLTTNPEVQYHLGMARYMNGDERGARAALLAASAATEDFAGRDKIAEPLAILELDVESAPESAIATLRARLESVPDDPIALLRLAGIHARLGRHAEAMARYAAAEKAHPGNPAVLVARAAYLLERPDGLAAAFELAKNAYKSAPDNPAVLHTLGRAAFRSGDHTWAASVLREAVRRSPENAGVQADFARAAYAVGNVADALSAAESSIRLKPDAPRASELQNFLVLVRAADAAPTPSDLELAAARLRTDANDVPALMVQARAAESSADSASAVSTYAAVLERYPQFTPALKARALALARQANPPPEALAAATKAREALPSDPAVAGALGTLHFRRGEFPRAATLLGESARAEGASPEIHFMLGMAQRQLGQTDRARASLQRALDLGLTGPSADEARAALAAP